MTQMPEVGRSGFIGLTAGAIAALFIPGSAAARTAAQSAGMTPAMPASWPRYHQVVFSGVAGR